MDNTEEKINNVLNKVKSWGKQLVNADPSKGVVPQTDGVITMSRILQTLQELQKFLTGNKALTLEVTTANGMTIKAFLYVNVFDKNNPKLLQDVCCIDSLVINADEKDDFKKKCLLQRFVNTAKGFQDFKA